MDRRRKHWGWGYEDQQPTGEALRSSAAAVAERLGIELGEVREAVALEGALLPPVRVEIPRQLAAFSAAGDHERASHALGSSYLDVVRGFNGRFEHAPDFVCIPREESELEQAIQWCTAARVAAVPFGGGTSVVGGVTPELPGDYNGAVSIDMREFDRVLEVDLVSRSALIEAGAPGPALERQLAEQGLTLRHFPQSFEFSTLGGWIATRAGGHFATLATHIEDLVESVRAITPAGEWESRRLPGSGAGVSPDRVLAGSEGILGIITRAWVRVQPRPDSRSAAALEFESFEAGAEAVRGIVQAGLHPSNCRLIDAAEAALNGAGDGRSAVLLLGFEATGARVDEATHDALRICAEHGGAIEGAAEPHAGDASTGERPSAGGREGAIGAWREAFLGVPYLRDVMVAAGVLAETFETAITWERLEALRESVLSAAATALDDAIGERAAREARVLCRLTHVYPDGAAPYFTVIAPVGHGAEAQAWGAVKASVSDAVLAAGGTITHHHAVGRDHRPWYDRQRPQPFALALAAAKAALDPAAVMNPGVLIDPPAARR